MISTLAVVSMTLSCASAFMIPPNVALEAISGNPAAANSIQNPHDVKVLAHCPGCPYADVKDNGNSWVDGVENSLFYSVTVNSEEPALEFNDIQIYPTGSTKQLSSQARNLRITQVPSTVRLEDMVTNMEKYSHHALPVTAWSLRESTIHPTRIPNEEIVQVKIGFDALAGHFINMPSVHITALKTSFPEVPGKTPTLEILNVTVAPNESYNKCPSHGFFAIICRIKVMMSNAASSVKGRISGCHRVRPTSAPMSAAEQHKAEDFKEPSSSNHHHTHPHHDVNNGKLPGHRVHRMHGHRHAHPFHHFIHKVARVLLTIAIPLMLGILAGMLTYTFGMLIGTIIGLLWVRFRHGSSQQPITLDDEETPLARESIDEKMEVYYDEVEVQPTSRS